MAYKTRLARRLRQRRFDSASPDAPTESSSSKQIEPVDKNQQPDEPSRNDETLKPKLVDLTQPFVISQTSLGLSFVFSCSLTALTQWFELLPTSEAAWFLLGSTIGHGVGNHALSVAKQQYWNTSG